MRLLFDAELPRSAERDLRFCSKDGSPQSKYGALTPEMFCEARTSCRLCEPDQKQHNRTQRHVFDTPTKISDEQPHSEVCRWCRKLALVTMWIKNDATARTFSRYRIKLEVCRSHATFLHISVFVHYKKMHSRVIPGAIWYSWNKRADRHRRSYPLS